MTATSFRLPQCRGSRSLCIGARSKNCDASQGEHTENDGNDNASNCVQCHVRAKRILLWNTFDCHIMMQRDRIFRRSPLGCCLRKKNGFSKACHARRFHRRIDRLLHIKISYEHQPFRQVLSVSLNFSQFILSHLLSSSRPNLGFCSFYYSDYDMSMRTDIGLCDQHVGLAGSAIGQAS